MPNNNEKKIVTHNGVFHADDVVAVAVLKELAELEGMQIKVVRTRDPEKICAADITIDVGGEYDPSRGRFDHHQRGRAGARANGIFYSSAGLVWREYGTRLVKKFLGLEDEVAVKVADIVDRRFVAPIDAVDNGQNLFSGGRPCFEGVGPLSFSSAISFLNPSYWQLGGGDRLSVFDVDFDRAVKVASKILLGAIASAYGEVRAEELVRAAVEDAGPDARVVEFESFVPWQDHIVKMSDTALYVIFPAEDGKWMVQCVPVAAGSFQARQPLPEHWAGLRDRDFATAAGVDDAIFCHPGRFICGAGTRGGARKLAELALRSGL